MGMICGFVFIFLNVEFSGFSHTNAHALTHTSTSYGQSLCQLGHSSYTGDPSIKWQVNIPSDTDTPDLVRS